MRWHDGLNGAALNVARYEGRLMRVLAGPGTGKTFALMRRAARLLQEGVPPQRILVVTFTRTAAKDLRERLQSLEAPGAEVVRAGTLHSLCFSILSRAEVLEFTGRVPRTLLDFDVDCLLHDISGRGLGGLRERRKRLGAFEAAWARLQHEEAGWPADAVDRAFAQAANGWLRFHEAILVGELVPLTLAYLRNNPGCAERTRFLHVLVDEYQDLNRAEQTLIDMLSDNAALAVVGDDDQAVYEFKFARPEGIVEFPATHPGTHSEYLVECQRCPRIVVEIANHLIRENEVRSHPPRELVCRAGVPQGEVRIVQWDSVAEEADGIARYVQHHIERHDVAANHVLVLSPRRIIGNMILRALDERGVPARCLFSEGALDTSSAQERFQLLNLALNPDDRPSLRWLLGCGSPSLRSGAYSRLRSYCEQNALHSRRALAQVNAGEVSISHVAPLAARYRQIEETLAQLGDLCEAESEPSDELMEAWLPEDDEEISLLRQLASEVREQVTNVKELFDEIRIRATRPEVTEEEARVRVMSLHKAKGLTADLVILAGCVDGVLPTLTADVHGGARQRQFEEQRRLFFVGITRTTNRLLISCARWMDAADAHRMRVRGRDYGGAVEAFATPFLTELGPNSPDPVTGQALLEAMQNG